MINRIVEPMPFLEEIFIRFLFMGFPCVILGNHIKLYNGRILDERMDCPRLCVLLIQSPRAPEAIRRKKELSETGSTGHLRPNRGLNLALASFSSQKFDSDVNLLTNMCHEAFTRQFTPVALRCFHFLSKREKKKKKRQTAGPPRHAQAKKTHDCLPSRPSSTIPPQKLHKCNKSILRRQSRLGYPPLQAGTGTRSK